MSGKNRTSPEKIGPLVHPDMSGKYQTSPNLVTGNLKMGWLVSMAQHADHCSWFGELIPYPTCQFLTILTPTVAKQGWAISRWTIQEMIGSSAQDSWGSYQIRKIAGCARSINPPVTGRGVLGVTGRGPQVFDPRVRQIFRARIVHAPGMLGTFSPATTGKRSRHASRHVSDARAVMHAGIAN